MADETTFRFVYVDDSQDSVPPVDRGAAERSRTESKQPKVDKPASDSPSDSGPTKPRQEQVWPGKLTAALDEFVKATRGIPGLSRIAGRGDDVLRPLFRGLDAIFRANQQHDTRKVNPAGVAGKTAEATQAAAAATAMAGVVTSGRSLAVTFAELNVQARLLLTTAMQLNLQTQLRRGGDILDVPSRAVGQRLIGRDGGAGGALVPRNQLPMENIVYARRTPMPQAGPIGGAAGGAATAGRGAALALGTVAALAVTAGAAALALGMVARRASQASETLAGYSGILAAAKARADVRQVRQDIVSAQSTGKVLAEFVDAQSRFSANFQEKMDAIINSALPIITALIEVANDSLDIIAGNIKNLDLKNLDFGTKILEKQRQRDGQREKLNDIQTALELISLKEYPDLTDSDQDARGNDLTRFDVNQQNLANLPAEALPL